ncbi:MAG: hypothetical protein R2813_04980 [Flavobacteriales bacterium]
MRSKYKYLLLSIIIFCAYIRATGQTINEPVANRGFYRSYNAGSFFLHTQGIGGSYRRGWRKTGFSNHILNIELLTFKDHKEFKITYPGSQLRGYYYGKISSVALIRASYGGQKTIFDKEVKRGVRVSHTLLYGPTLALVKPVYVSFTSSQGGRLKEEIVKYSTSLHSDGEVKGRAPALYKLNSTDIYPGLHIKYALNFEYSQDDAFIRALETGAAFDAFYKRLPIMENGFNEQFYLTAYLAFVFGKREL